MQDFTEGRIGRQVFNFTTPIMLGNLLMSAYGIINLMWVGRLLGPSAVAAVAASLPIIMLMPALLIGLGMATNVLIAQAFGRKDMDLLRVILANSFFASSLFCLLISAVALAFKERMLDWVNVPPDIRAMASTYLTIMMASLVLQFFVNWMNGMLRGLGDARTVLKILGMLTLLNITFVPLLISGIGPLPAMGVAGAAWGSALAALVSGVVGYIYLMRHNPYINMRSWTYRVDWQIIRQVFTIGVPASLQMLVVSLAGVFILALVNRYGSHVTAAFGIGLQIDMLVSIPFMSIGMAATSIAAQNLGAGKMERVYQTLRISVAAGLLIGVLCTALLLLFPYQIGSLFLKETADSVRVLDVLRGYYRWMAFIFPCFAVIYAIQGVLRSAGDTMAPLILSFTAMFVIRIPLAYFLAGPAGFAQDGIWMAMLASSSLAVGLNWLYFRYGPWKKKHILGSAKT